MPLTRSWRPVALCWAAALWLAPTTARAQNCGPDGCDAPAAQPHTVLGLLKPASPCCGPRWCCPKTTFCHEKPPRIRFKCTCAKPVLACSEIEGHGYYPACWRPYGPLNYSHCQQAAPANIAVPPHLMPDPKKDEGEMAPKPGKISAPRQAGL
jgi:hypothetical protein